jgi:4-cresol dehydrogenase (hydroxylating)
VLRRLVAQGYIPYRLGIQSMPWFSSVDDGYAKFLRTLKAVLDPNDILAPGRYGSGDEPG